MTDVIDEARVATNPGALIESAALPESVAASKSERSLLDRLLSDCELGV